MLVGHDNLRKSFQRLHKEGNLSHSYMFFGETQVGKRTFAESLANYLETGEFEKPSRVLLEFFYVKPILEGVSESIGIDAIRNLKNFLFQKPLNSEYRVAVIDEAELMTDQAQNAVLKVAEEPPEHALLILIVSNPETLLTTVRSRFQGVYFTRVSSDQIANNLLEQYKLKPEEAKKIASMSFGRPGRAIDLATNASLKETINTVKGLMNSSIPTKEIISRLADPENKAQIKPFFTELVAELSRDVKSNHLMLKSALHGFRILNEWNVNRRLQLESTLREIVKK